MVTLDAIVAPGAAVDEAKVYLRIDGSEEDALLARLVATAIGCLEGFGGQVALARGASVTMAACTEWRRLPVTPVLAAGGAELIGADGTATPLAVGDYAVDIDANGDGWVRLTSAPSTSSGQGWGRVRLAVSAGLASDWGELPEALRQGVTRLTAHLFAHRDAEDDAGPPAAVAALWRPWRRMRLR